MKRSNIRALALLVAAMLVIAQIAGAQTQSSTPQPSQNSNNNGKIVRPEPPPPRQQQQKQAQQQQDEQKQQQQPQSQQQNQPQPQQQQQQEQLQPPQQPQQQQRQHQARRVRRSNPNPVPASVMSYSSALQRCQRERHNRNWWSQHFAVIVLVGGGYYYFDSGYWFPALGFDPNYEAYDYDGPVFTYGNLLPDQVILNVQRALADLGYYNGALSGSLSAATRYAISAYQQDNGLVVNGVVDAPLVYSLGLQ
jgi:flagellar motor protein MotB